MHFSKSVALYNSFFIEIMAFITNYYYTFNVKLNKMKNFTKIFGMAILAMVLFASCTKSPFKKIRQEKPAEVIDLNYTVKAGESFAYNMPVADEDDINMIQVNSAIAVVSGFQGNSYTYTAPTIVPYDIADEVVLAVGEVRQGNDNDGKRHNSKGGHCGNSNDKQSVEKIINLHIKVLANSSNK
jgi:hypothetical protein